MKFKSNNLQIIKTAICKIPNPAGFPVIPTSLENLTNNQNQTNFSKYIIIN